MVIPRKLKYAYKDNGTVEKGATAALLELTPSQGTTIAINSSTWGGTVVPERLLAKLVYRLGGDYSAEEPAVKYRACVSKDGAAAVAFYSPRLSKGNWYAIVSGICESESEAADVREAVEYFVGILRAQGCVDAPSALDEELLPLACKEGPDSSTWIAEKVRRTDVDYSCIVESQVKKVPCPVCGRLIGDRPMGLTSEICDCHKTTICFNALCNRPIASDDKICPHCGKKQPGMFASCLAGLLGLLALIAIATVAALASRGCS
ncbi:MAG: hypothetical protein HQ582_18515 [Planctomycetes bacterium]|nr:hypothetical protein [Planctomycetota bacterium]